MDPQTLQALFAQAPAPDSPEFVEWFAKTFQIPPNLVATVMRDNPEALMTLLDQTGQSPPGQKSDFGGDALGAAVAAGEGQPPTTGGSWWDWLTSLGGEGAPEGSYMGTDMAPPMGETGVPSAPATPTPPQAVSPPTQPLPAPAPATMPHEGPNSGNDPVMGDARYMTAQTPAATGAQVAASAAPSVSTAQRLVDALGGVQMPEAPQDQILQPPVPPAVRPLDTAISQRLMAQLPGPGGANRLALGKALGG